MAGSAVAGPLVPGVRRIAVLRANRLGDLLFALPALEALRAAYPEAEVTLLGARWHAAFLSGRPSPVDRVVPVPPTPGVNDVDGGYASAPEREAFLAELRRERFDLALQLHGGGRNSNPFVAGLGARVTAGARAEDAPPLDRWIRYVYYQNEVTRFLELVGLVGARPVGLAPAVAVTAADLAESRAALPDGAGFVVLCPGASDGRRRWPPERFARVGEGLARAGWRVAVTGTGEEAALVAAVLAGLEGGGLDLAGRLSVGGLAGLLARAALVVSNDSGPLHLAGAVGTPSVGIYWIGNLVNGGPPFRARHRPLLAFRTACPVCGVNCSREDCPHDDSFVAEVEPAAVLAAAEDLIAHPGPELGRLEAAA